MCFVSNSVVVIFFISCKNYENSAGIVVYSRKDDQYFCSLNISPQFQPGSECSSDTPCLMNTNLSRFLTAEIGSSVHASDLY